VKLRLLERLRRKRRDPGPALPLDLAREAGFAAAWERCRPFTMTSPERMYALWSAVHYVSAARLPGDVVECGVWKGGSSMLAALALLAAGDLERTLWLYDTFTGMTEPSDRDVDHSGRDARVRFARAAQEGGWFVAAVDEVRSALAITAYPAERLRFVAGKVEETIPQQVPERIALLRLDTDWYESTRHELEHLWPRLVPGGVLLVDDYGHWQGARRAVDEYFARQATPLLLQRIDYTGRIAVKPAR